MANNWRCHGDPVKDRDSIRIVRMEDISSSKMPDRKAGVLRILQMHVCRGRGRRQECRLPLFPCKGADLRERPGRFCGGSTALIKCMQLHSAAYNRRRGASPCIGCPVCRRSACRVFSWEKSSSGWAMKKTHLPPRETAETAWRCRLYRA